jgi:hypothetical protein
MFLQRLEFCRQLRITKLIRVEIADIQTDAMFYLARAKVVQERPPLLMLFQVFGDMLGHEDVPGIAAIHHPLGHIDSGAGDVGPLIHIGDLIHWAAVNTHAKPDRGMTFQRPRNLHRALRRRLGISAEDKRHAVASRQTDQFSCRVGLSKFVCSADDVVQLT